MTAVDPAPDAADQAVATAEAADAAEDAAAEPAVAAPAAPPVEAPAPAPVAPESAPPVVEPVPPATPVPAPVVPPAKVPFKAASYTASDGTVVQAHVYDASPGNVLEFAEWVDADNLSVVNDQLVIHVGDTPLVVLPDVWVVLNAGAYTVANEAAFATGYTVVPA